VVISFRSIKKIEWPVYALPSSNWELADGLLFLDGQLLDDKNVKERTLGLRRLKTPLQGLMPLRKQIDTITALLKQSTNCFIDSLGRPFIYEKTTMCELKYYEILRVDRKDTASLLWVKGVSFPFTIPRPPEDGMLWAGVLHFHGLPWILYEYAETKLKDTRRKV
jgi:hypothetical protein